MKELFEKHLIEWDGKSVDDLEILFMELKKLNSMASLIDFVSDARWSRAATWLLKRFRDEGQSFTSAQKQKLVSQALNVVDSFSHLHLLQLLNNLGLDSLDSKLIEQYARKCLVDSNKFVRAWSYNAFYLLAKAHPEFEPERKQLFDLAKRDESASIKARIRQIERIIEKDIKKESPT